MGGRKEDSSSFVSRPLERGGGLRCERKLLQSARTAEQVDRLAEERAQGAKASPHQGTSGRWIQVGQHPGDVRERLTTLTSCCDVRKCSKEAAQPAA